MSTPVTPIVTTTTAKATPTIAKDIKVVEAKFAVLLDPKHLVLLGLLVIALLGGTYLWESKRADVAEAKAEVATQVAQVAREASASSAIQNAANQEQAKEVEAAMVAANQQLITANSQLTKANTQLASQLALQQKADAAMTPTQQSARWSQLVPTAVVTPTSVGFTIDANGGLLTIQDLEKINTDATTIANFEKEVANDEQEITNTQASLKAEQAAHQSDLANSQKQLTTAQDDLKQTKAEFVAYKHHARKMYIIIGVLSFITGRLVNPASL